MMCRVCCLYFYVFFLSWRQIYFLFYPRLLSVWFFDTTSLNGPAKKKEFSVSFVYVLFIFWYIYSCLRDLQKKIRTISLPCHPSPIEREKGDEEEGDYREEVFFPRFLSTCLITSPLFFCLLYSIYQHIVLFLCLISFLCRRVVCCCFKREKQKRQNFCVNVYQINTTFRCY